MTMMIKSQTVDDVLVVSLAGDLDSSTAPEVQDQLHTLIEPGGRVLIDLSDVPYMSSAGLRTMLLVYRQSESSSCRIGLTGVSLDLRHMMSAVGFLDFFALCDTVAAGVRFLDTPLRGTA
jgi:anti-sigma B factor antagonist